MRRSLCLLLLPAFTVLGLLVGCAESPREEAQKVNPSGPQAEATHFFEEFSRALEDSAPTLAAAMVAPDHRNRFTAGYSLWRGCQFFDANVVESSPSDDTLQVQISFKVPSGTEHTETKRLVRVDGQWLLADS